MFFSSENSVPMFFSFFLKIWIVYKSDFLFCTFDSPECFVQTCLGMCDQLEIVFLCTFYESETGANLALALLLVATSGIKKLLPIFLQSGTV